MAAFDCDLFVIGAGSGGTRAARIAAGHGARVIIAEEFRFGGTCVIRGCVPKKLLMYASRFADEFENAAGFGWTVGEPAFDWHSLIAAKDRDIGRLEGLYRTTLANAGVTVLHERGEFVDAHTIRVGERIFRAGKILIATGSRPSLGDAMPGIEHAITSNEAFDLARLPGRIVIYGGGYIAVEFASIFAGLGSEVTIVYRGDEILRGFDHDLRVEAAAAYAARGIAIIRERRIAALSQDDGGKIATLDDGQAIAADTVMFAIGRLPNTANLGLDRAGVALGWNGHVVVDEEQRSNVPSIFAIGDVTDRFNLTPVAIREGHAFADSQFGSRPWMADTALVPTAVFSTPEIATVGLTEQVAAERCPKLDIFKARFRPMKNVLAGRQEWTLMKLVVDRESDRVLGCHMMGADAAEIIQMAAVAIRLGATKADFDATMALHPSAAEELVTMRVAWSPPEMPKKGAVSQGTVA